MNKPETGPDARADTDWGLQFIAGFILMSGIALAVFGLVVIPAIEVMDDNGGTVTVTSDVSRGPEIKALFPSDVSTKGVDLSPASDEYQLTVQPLPTGLRLLTIAPISWATLCLLGIAWMLFGLLRSIGQGRPFDPGNARRLSALAVLAIAGSLVFRALESLAASAVLGHLNLSGGNLQPPGIWVLWPFAVAVLLAALARAFRYGGQLQDDVAGMV
jgi:hypothetical protein